MPVATKKRIVHNLLELRPCELAFLILGHDFFNDINMDTIQDKWEVHRDMIMKHWNTHKPFDLLGYHFDENKPGTYPYAHTVYDKKEEFKW